jgi:ATP adenylyltransferase
LATHPFPHALANLGSPEWAGADDDAQAMLELYYSLLQTHGISRHGREDDPIDQPYNLLVTRRWMLLVPRTRESFESVSLNALAFAGALLVRNQQEMDLLKSCGPMQALRHVTLP